MASKQNTNEYPIQIIREKLRQCSAQQAALLSRSVGRLTSCDALPCLEYRSEIANEHAIIRTQLGTMDRIPPRQVNKGAVMVETMAALFM